MALKTSLLALAVLSRLASASPASSSSTEAEVGLRLVKTSEDDPGQWVSEEAKFELFTSKGLGFIDITDIKDAEVLAALSTKPANSAGIQAVGYPSALAHIEEANALIDSSSTDGPKEWLEHLASYRTRHYQSPTGKEASDWLFAKVTEIASANTAITVEKFEHSFDQPSIIARLPGKSDELVILGAHYDSTSGNATTVSPGADDNASGSVVVLESLRVLAQAGFAPDNTLEFHWYGGEEGGLLGSADVYRAYKNQNKTVLSFVNQDMAGYSASGTAAIVEDYTDPGLNAFVRILATQYQTGEPLEPNAFSCGYGCSDHASATANGFPSALLFEDFDPNTSPYIHTPNDAPNTIMWPTVQRHFHFAIGYLVEASYI
ncbi:hypothetical protein V2G26_012282 [Clonostachys chloroleuca]